MNIICEFTFVFLLIIGSTFSHNIVIREVTYEGDESSNNNGGSTNVNSAENIDTRSTGSGSGEGSGATDAPITSCTTLLMPTNGAVLSCTDGYNLGSVCSFSCVSGFYIVGSSVLTCGQDGLWDAAAPVCSDAPTTTAPPTTTTVPPTTTQPPTTTTAPPVSTTTSGSSITKGAYTVLVVSSLLAIQNFLF